MLCIVVLCTQSSRATRRADACGHGPFADEHADGTRAADAATYLDTHNHRNADRDAPASYPHRNAGADENAATHQHSRPHTHADCDARPFAHSQSYTQRGDYSAVCDNIGTDHGTANHSGTDYAIASYTILDRATNNRGANEYTLAKDYARLANTKSNGDD